MADVFVSYAKTDRALAESVVRGLEAAGFSVWWDDRLTPTESWDRLIEQQIADAKAVVVLWTKASVASDWVRIEATFGKEHQKLVQARCDECTTPLAFTLLQRAELAGWTPEAAHDGWDKLMAWVRGLAKQPEPPSNIAYWEAFHAVAERKGVRRPLLTAVKGTNYYLALSRQPEVSIAAYISRAKGGSISAYLAMWYEPAQAIFEALKRRRSEIEERVGETLIWSQPAATTYWIEFRPVGADPDNTADWPRQHVLLADRLARLKAVFEPLLPTVFAEINAG